MRTIARAPRAVGLPASVRPWLLLAFAGALFHPGAARPDEPKTAAQQADAAVPAQGEPPVQAESDEVRGREQRVLRQVIFRDRQTQANVDQAEAAFRRGDAPRGVELLQQILDQRGDHFVWVEREQQLASARHRALNLLSAANSKTRALYNWAYAHEAKRLLEAGKAAGDPNAIGEVARRFFHTAAGFEATDWLATHWLDRGEYALAVRAWSQLAADAVHSTRITATIRRKVEVAQRLLARNSNPTPWAFPRSSDIRTAEVSAADDRRSDEEESPPSKILPVAAAFDAVPSDAPARPALPYMKPAWRLPLSGGKGPVIDSAVRHWEIELKRDDRQAVTVHSALVAGSAIVFRTYEGICAVDGRSGKPLWNYNSGTSFLRAWSDVPQSGNGDAGTINETTLREMMTTYAGNSILGTLATDGRRIFAVDSFDLRLHSSAPAPDEPEPHEGSRKFSRNANRLVALDLYSPALDREGAVTPIWTVGGSMGSTNWFYRMDTNDDGRVTAAEFLGSAEEFRKLDRNGDGAIDRAESENPEVKLERHPLHGHFFLGPPLVLDGRVYAVTECESQLNLVALRAETGAVLWIQGIGYVDRPIDEDSLRNTLACTPCYSSGVIVCPTQMGVLVGVDALDGALLWTYYYGDDDVTASESAWSFVSHRPYGNPGFANPPLIDGNRVVILPRQSDSIHCLDLTTGHKLWKQPRNDAEFIAAAADGVVMVVGERTSCGLSLANGRLRWSTKTGAVSGCGLRAGTQYLLPLAENRVVAIDMRTGVRTGMSTPEESPSSTAKPLNNASDTSSADSDNGPTAERNSEGAAAHFAFADRPGNLAGSGRFILSLGPREIVAYPRAEVLLNEVKDRLAGADPSPEDLLLAAELELTLGGGPAARSYLDRLPATGLSASASDRKSRFLRAVLYQELAARPDDSSAILGELDRLSQTPFERGAFLQAKLAADLRRGDWNGALESARRFAALGMSELLPSPVDSSHQISSASWLASTDEQIRGKLDRPALEQATARLATEAQALLKSSDAKALERYLAVYSSWPEAEVVRLHLAELLARAGEFQRAELLLIQTERTGRTESQIRARRQLAHLWAQAGMAEEAAELLLQEAHPRLEEFPPDSLVRLAYHRLQEAARPARRVRISQSLWEHCDRELDETYANASRPFVTRPMSPFQLIDRGSTGGTEISIVDRLSGTILDTLRLPTQCRASSLASIAQVGHFLPLGGRGALHGVSLLDRDRQRPVWTTSPGEIALDSDAALVGPSGPTFCVFQSHGHLFIVDPGTGKILWQRTDLDPQSGLVTDSTRGIFGDSEVIVVLGADHLEYTAYRTLTGEELRHGRLDSESRQTQDRCICGRCLAYVTVEETNRRLRIWDPLVDRLLYDRPISDRLLWKETGEDEIAVVGADSRLQIVDGRTGSVRVSIEVPSHLVQNACQLAVFRDAARYYVNLQPVQSPPEPRFYNYFFGTDTVLPHIDVRGDVLAIDRQNGRLVWRRSFQQRTVVRTPSLQLPVLVMLASVGDRLNGNHRSMLIEAVDTRTGETLGLENNKFADRILQFSYDFEQRRVRLWGKRSVVDLDFTKAGDPLAAGSESD
jgi:outer membrane protein assembly factor BamB